MTAKEAAARLGKLAPAVSKLTAEGLAKTLLQAKGLAVKDILDTGLGRRAFKNSGAAVGRKLFVPTKLHAGGATIKAQVKAYGLAATMEIGGRTRPHSIPRRWTRARVSKAGALTVRSFVSSSRRLAFQGRNGLVVTPGVKHPGGPVHAVHALEANVRREVEAMPRRLDPEYQRLVTAVVG